MSEGDCPDAETEEVDKKDEEGKEEDRGKDKDEEKPGESGSPEFWEAESATTDSST